MFSRACWTVFGFALGWLSFGFGSTMYDTIHSDRSRAHMQATALVHEKRVTIFAESDGSLLVTGDMHNIPQRFYIDTGATTVVLTYENAVSIGLRPEDYPRECFDTTNGRSCGYAFVIGQLKIGEIVVQNVRAGILQPGKFHTNLLGMAFLKRLKSFEFNGKSQSFTLVQ